MQLMERELRKLRSVSEGRKSAASSNALGRSRKPIQDADTDADEIGRKLEQYVSVAKGEINRLDYIVTQFLHAIRPTPPQLKPASLNQVVETTLELLEPELQNRGLHVKTRLARQLPDAPIDGQQMQQVLVNLVKNAMQAMTKGGTLTLQTGETSEGVWLSVMDTGGGIPQEQINRIFEPFYTTKKKGSGLGLMIVQRIVGAHGGKIDLESQVGRGTTFRIWLPLHERKPRLLEAPVQ
jgi:signal transduction histidine kinase